MCDKNSLEFFNNPKINKIFVTHRGSYNINVREMVTEWTIHELKSCCIEDPIVWCTSLGPKSKFILQKLEKELLNKSVIVMIDDMQSWYFYRKFFKSLCDKNPHSKEDLTNLELFKCIKNSMMLFL